MRGKKTAQLAYRLTDDEKNELAEVAEELRMKPAEIVSVVMAQFISARQRYGRYLVWPPEFNHFMAHKPRQNLMAAEERSTYGNGNGEQPAPA